MHEWSSWISSILCTLLCIDAGGWGRVTHPEKMETSCWKPFQIWPYVVLANYGTWEWWWRLPNLFLKWGWCGDSQTCGWCLSWERLVGILPSDFSVWQTPCPWINALWYVPWKGTQWFEKGHTIDACMGHRNESQNYCVCGFNAAIQQLTQITGDHGCPPPGLIAQKNAMPERQVAMVCGWGGWELHWEVKHWWGPEDRVIWKPWGHFLLTQMDKPGRRMDTRAQGK